MPASFTAAAVQFEPQLAMKERNLAALLALARDAADDGASLIVLPEMGTTGYCWHDRQEVAPHVEPVPGPTTERFSQLAAERGVYLVVGMPEVDPATNLYYNSAVLIGPQGVIGTHRKTHPYISEPKWAASGNLGHQVFETPLGRLCLLICMDIHFVETARLAALGGADVICHISNWLAERTPAPYWINRAFENGCYLVESNRWGLERGVQFSGGSCIIDPEGDILACLDRGDGYVLAEIDPARARARTLWGEPIMARRRPELYAELMTNTFAWNPRDFFGLYGHEPMPDGRPARLAVAEFAPTDRIADNLASMLELAGRASATGADLLVLPELCLTGLKDPAAHAVDCSDPAFAALQAAVDGDGLCLVFGFAERRGALFHNSAACLRPGQAPVLYRKIHLTGEDEAWASAGEDWVCVDTDFGRIGLLVGFDASIPEAGRILALRGADILACPAAVKGRFHAAHAGTQITQPDPIPTGPDPMHWHQYRVRGGENNCYFAFANVVDAQEGYPGLSGVFGPDTFAFPRQEAIAGPNDPLVSCAVDTRHVGGPYPTHVVRRKDLVLMRQPHFYEALVRP